MNHKKLIFIFEILFNLLMQISITNATFNTTINLFNSDKDSNFFAVPANNLTLSYFFNTEEKIVRNVDTGQVSSINFEEEFFCYSNCNIVPKRIIYRIDIEENDELLSRQEFLISNPNNNQIIDIYLGKKINSKTELIPIKSSINLYEENIIPQNNYLIEWNGQLNVTESSNYAFYVDIPGGIKVILDNNMVLNEWENGNNSIRKFTIDLSNGIHTLNISYWTLKNKNINLLWKKFDSDNPIIISEDNLIFNTGYIKEEKIDDSQKTKILSTVTNFPESYQINYQTYPSAVKGYYGSINRSRVPILMIHGLHGSDKINKTDTSTWTYWNDIPSKLSSMNNDVWVLFYYPANISNFMTSGLLKNEINNLLSYYSTSKVDIVSHSMGGLVTLGYIENLGKNQYGNSVNYSNNIRKYVAIAGPLHGSYSANRILLKINSASNPACSILDWFLSLFGAGNDPNDKDAQAYLDLAVGSEFTYLLNKNQIPSDLISNMLVITGNTGILCIPDETLESSDDPRNGNDGLVAVSSASLLDKNIPLIIFGDYNHINEKGQYLSGLKYDADREYKSINGFIKGYSKNTIKSYFNTGDYYIDPTNSTSNPFNKGMVVIKIISPGSVSSVKLKNTNNEYYSLTEFKDLRHNTETNNWYYFSDNSDLADTDSKYGLTLSKGNYKIYINDNYINEDIEIKGAQTTMKEIDLTPFDSNNQSVLTLNINDNVNVGEEILVFNNSGIIINTKGRVLNKCYINLYKGVIGRSEEILIDISVAEPGEDFNNQNFDRVNSDSYYRAECISNDNKSRIYTNFIWVRIISEKNCTIPYNGVEIKHDIKLCQGNYHFLEGIKVSGNYVTLDCNNSSFIGNGKGKGIDIKSFAVHIRNCKISNYSDGIFFINSTSIFNSYIYSNKIGINGSGYIEAQFNRVHNNYIGIFMKGSDVNYPFIRKNDIYDNGYNIMTSVNSRDIDARQNWWGTSNESKIAYKIYDYYDDSSRGKVFFDLYFNNSLTGVCEPDWIETNWSFCYKNNSKYKDWTDLNSCKDNSTKPAKIMIECDYCKPILINTSWSNWTDQELCRIDDNKSQKRTRIEYDSNYNNCYGVTNLSTDLWNNGVNKTYLEFRNSSCNYCTSNITGPFYTGWSECLRTEFKQDRIKYYTDTNYTRCCAVTRLIDDCEINYNKVYWNETQSKTCKWPLIIMNPNSGTKHDTHQVILNVSANDTLTEIKYIDYFNKNLKPQWKTLCKKDSECSRFMNFVEGNHTFIVKGLLNNNIVYYDNVSFFIDSFRPRITETSPRANYFMNSTSLFKTEYKEENPVWIDLYINGNKTKGAPLLKNQRSTNFGGILENYDGQFISYYFVLKDIAGNTAQSKSVKVYVDTTPPEIKSFNYSFSRGNIVFNISIEEKNFDKVEFIEGDNKRILCSRLNKNNGCIAKVRISSGSHNLIIRVLDKAGNSIERSIIF